MSNFDSPELYPSHFSFATSAISWIFYRKLKALKILIDCARNIVVNIFSAFTHGGDAAAGCPTDTDWTVKNVNSWVAVKNFARCQGENEDEENAYRLSYSVCDIIKSIDTDSDNERVRSSLQKRKNTLCNRAMNHARVSHFFILKDTTHWFSPALCAI